jgi:hypothetical protein
MKILDLKEAKCAFCEKDKECFEIELENGRKVTLCIPDLKKTVKMKLLAQEQ